VRLRRGGQFDELVARQLTLLAEDEADLLQEAADAEDAWVQAGRETAEEAYGDYQLVVDALADRLLEIRESYAATLTGDTAAEYRRAFGAAAARRFRRYASLVADLEP
jgi:hypothetical protein